MNGDGTVGAGCETPAEHAASATIHAFLNCYLRETGDYEVVRTSRTPIDAGTDRTAVCELDEQRLELFVPLRYESPTGRHLFELPVRYRSGDGEPVPADAATLAALLGKELSLAAGGEGDLSELLRRVLVSERNVERFVEGRADDAERLYGFETDFRDAEQSLVYGHLLHPTPKSREGIADHEAGTYAPELRGSFPLYYFRADPSVLDGGSAREESAVEWVKSELRADDEVPASFVDANVEGDDALVPIHPWQADYLLDQPHVRAAIDDGVLEPLGRVGREYFPTTSVRTAYSPESSFMHKGSLAVQITNSERTNKLPELDRGVAVAELLETELGEELRDRFPGFDVVRDPAYLTLDLGAYQSADEGPESGFEVVLRENPFRGLDAANATPVVGLCQDGIDGPSRLARIVETLAEREGRSTAAVSRDWFRRYLDRSLRPILWLYLTWGVGVEAHQQNSVLRLDGGYPAEFFYRDNQGYYFCESTYDEVDALLPGVGERADTICPDAVADERIRYYVVLNNVFGVVNAFGVADLVDERDLLAVLREELRSLREFDRDGSELVESLLSERRLPCKANLRTRVRDMDELVGSLEEQSVYTEIPNPIVTELEVTQS
ncbi:IucA/IucC family protein [Halegenticoccus tardaugens]|uniref:IucA/IucC family protein n=1 Tax=Halegenticoccus tardaugens TaxID=2071624 RepID=UPI00100B4EA1|nr:IucA/IucC family protein [Halegenticoccus tardaugens]